METYINKDTNDTDSNQNGFKLPFLSNFQLFSLAVGIIGIQFAWSMQIAFSSRILEPLGANPFLFGLIWCAGPITGIVIPPLVGAISDRTWTKIGRRRPFIIAGTLIAALMLFLFPLAPSLGAATLLLWIMNATANAAQSPYRALVPDNVPDKQQVVANSYINFAYGAGSIISLGIAPLLLLFHVSISIVQQFLMTSIIFVLTIGYSCMMVKEYPKPAQIDESKKQESFGAMLKKFFTYDKEINKLCGIQVFIWIGMMSIYIYLTPFVVHNIYGLPDMSTPYYNHQRAVHIIIDPLSEDVSNNSANTRFIAFKDLAEIESREGTQKYQTLNNKLDSIIARIVPSGNYDKDKINRLYRLAKQDPALQIFHAHEKWHTFEKAAEYKFLIINNILSKSNKVPESFSNSELGKNIAEDLKQANKFGSLQKAEEKATNTAQIALVVLNTVSLLLSLPLGFLCYKYSKKLVYGTSLAFAVIACLFAPFIHTPLQTCIMAGFIGVTAATMLSIPYAMLADYLPKGEEGTSMGIFNIFIAGPQVISAVVVGWIISMFPMKTALGTAHNWSIAFVIASLCIFLAIISLQFMKEKKQD